MDHVHNYCKTLRMSNIVTCGRHCTLKLYGIFEKSAVRDAFGNVDFQKQNPEFSVTIGYIKDESHNMLLCIS